ncbi:uncharacterized protein LY79DRAFT_553541 [Colletotrichum navitas]|uniref:Uncharacterized protein n=1 Tax=Colletotrichum navitas TaxID=681940 RepID=A0AAD8PZD0_9PEZI|nr:uncharacterized protein LY79DRAFT_553541 [Colletotrichum navitas]KAK1590908.1 hypothetical protein LY79DRAFT_553541 [Colletotrichum navitas]
MCYVYRHRHVCCNCSRIMSSQDKTGWCEKRIWVRPSPFEHAVPYCSEGTKLIHLDYKVMRCVDCHFGPSRLTRAVDTPRQDTRLPEQRQGQHDEQTERDADGGSEAEAPGRLWSVGRYVCRVLAGWAVTVLGGVPVPSDHPAYNRS